MDSQDNHNMQAVIEQSIQSREVVDDKVVDDKVVDDKVVDDKVVAGEASEVRNVTGFIRFNKDEDLTPIFNTLYQFRTSHGLKYSHHHRHGLIFFSVKSDCLAELAKVQPFSFSHFLSKKCYFFVKFC